MAVCSRASFVDHLDLADEDWVPESVSVVVSERPVVAREGRSSFPSDDVRVREEGCVPVFAHCAVSLPPRTAWAIGGRRFDMTHLHEEIPRLVEQQLDDVQEDRERKQNHKHLAVFEVLPALDDHTRRRRVSVF